MVQILLVAIGAGAAAALLFASIATGSIIATLLFYLAPLPILIAAMGWSHLAGLLARAARGDRPRARASASISSWHFPVRCRLAGLVARLPRAARPPRRRQRIRRRDGVVSGRPPGLLGRRSSAHLVIVVAVLSFGTDKATFQTEIRSAFERSAAGPGPDPRLAGRADTGRVIDILVIAAATGRRGAADDPQHVQSLARRADRKGLGPVCAVPGPTCRP